MKLTREEIDMLNKEIPVSPCNACSYTGVNCCGCDAFLEYGKV